jgi:hypothetical protein
MLITYREKKWFVGTFFLSKFWKESLNSDYQQLHQYQQNEQLPLTSTCWS